MRQDADTYIGVQYNGYKDHQAFYSDMSAVLVSNGTKQSGHFAIPHLVLQSFDDPISAWRTNAANDPFSPLFPERLVQHENSTNLVVMLTDKGGHVGWPMGYWPHTWKYMNNLVAAGFVASYIESANGLQEASLEKGDTESIQRDCHDELKTNDSVLAPLGGLLTIVSLQKVT
jgi:predicted alpha/beta-fold hydrolase